MITVKTNNVPREVIDAWTLTSAERKEFDYINWDDIEEGTDSASFFRYKGELYDLGEFMFTRNTLGLEEWDGYQSDTHFSGMVVKYIGSTCDEVIVGTYYAS